MPPDIQYTEIIQKDKRRIQTSDLKVKGFVLILSHLFPNHYFTICYSDTLKK